MHVPHNLASNAENRTFLNSDADYALDVLVEILRTSNQIVRIFAGSLCQHLGNQEEYIKAISDFIMRGGSVRIMLNKYNEDEAKKSNLFKRLAYFINDGKDVTIKITKKSPYRVNDPDKKEVHFTIGDNKAYRIETDIKQRAAEGNFNNPDIADLLVAFYDSLFDTEDAVAIDITKLFE